MTPIAVYLTLSALELTHQSTFGERLSRDVPGEVRQGEEKLDDKGSTHLAALPERGDPNAEVAIAYRVKERLRDFYRVLDPK